jgi:cyclic patellamide precursor peptide PatG
MDQSDTNEVVTAEAAEPRAVAVASALADSANSIPRVQSERNFAAIRPSKSGFGALPAQVGPAPCPTCGGAGTQGAMTSASYVYALGQIEARFPRLAVEKEMAQAIGRADTASRTDQQAFHQALSQPESRYLARQMCWVLTIQGLETYILTPRDQTDLGLLIAALNPQPLPPISTVIGVRGPIAPPDYCNGLMVPIVIFDQIYTFSRDALIQAIPRPEAIPAEEFEAAARELFDRIIQMTDNAGATDEHRALNYLAMRYPAIYARAAQSFAEAYALSAVDVRLSPLSGTRKIIDVIFSYTNRNTDYTEKYFVRCDMTEEFPFLVTKMSPYYDR